MQNNGTGYYADVILPLRLNRSYTYRVPEHLLGLTGIGKRVIVPFSGSKLYTAVIFRVHETPPLGYQPKPIESVIDEYAAVTPLQLRLWQWISEYYICTEGEVMHAALPSGMKLSSEKKIVLHPEWIPDMNELNDQEYMIVEALEVRKMLNIQEVSDIPGLKNTHKLIRTLLTRGIIIPEEELTEKVKPRFIDGIKLSSHYNDEKNLEKYVNEIALKKSQSKQLELILTYLKMSRDFSDNPRKVMKSELIRESGNSDAALKTLIRKGIFESFKTEVSRFHVAFTDRKEITLSAAQQDILEKITKQFKEKQVVLLKGITSSGKTEIYLRLMEQVLRDGKQVLYLLPEIAITVQIIDRIQNYFGRRAGIYHSKFNEAERVEVWNSMLRTIHAIPHEEIPEYSIIIGVRSSVFLPFHQLGLIIVDEEHDPSYKQNEPTPRYHARDTAIYLAQLHGAKVLLGSATPSVESFYHAQTGKYGYCELNERYGGVEPPEIILADINRGRKIGENKSQFTGLLIDHIQQSLDAREQVILFKNRRGYAPVLECDTCHWTRKCNNCDVNLTFHKAINLLRCHYCGYTDKVPDQCPRCASVELSLTGTGTEKIEEDLAVLFPSARTARMDLDTTRSKNSFRQIIQDFESQVTDILIGTQMVTKGLDFSNVGLVGIVQADQMLAYPDFRAHERAFQLMLQVAGRAGRKKAKGRVIIQTANSEHFIIRQVVTGNYPAFYNSQIAERESYHYPPFYRIIRFTFKHKQATMTDEAAHLMSETLRTIFGKSRVLGPEYPPVARINNYFLKHAMLKLEKNFSTSVSRKLIQDSLSVILKDPVLRKVLISIDVDPY